MFDFKKKNKEARPVVKFRRISTAGFTRSLRNSLAPAVFLGKYFNQKVIRLSDVFSNYLIWRKKPRLFSSAGFTMIEAFVAITVLLVAVLGPLTLITRAIIDGNYAKYQVTASFLMQEGLDLVVAKAAELSASDDINGLNPGSTCSVGIPCQIFFDNENVSIIPPFPPTFVLYTDNTTGVYSYKTTNGTKSIFSRKIWFEDVALPATDVRMNAIGLDTIIGKKVFVQLDWAYRGVIRSQIASTIVYE